MILNYQNWQPSPAARQIGRDGDATTNQRRLLQLKSQEGAGGKAQDMNLIITLEH
jgi:hypothetical protein